MSLDSLNGVEGDTRNGDLAGSCSSTQLMLKIVFGLGLPLDLKDDYHTTTQSTSVLEELKRIISCLFVAHGNTLSMLSLCHAEEPVDTNDR